MHGIFQVKGLEQRKKQLVSRSEIYREMIRLDLQNVSLTVEHTKRKVSWVKTSVLPIVAGIAGLFALRRKAKVSPVRGIASIIGKQLLQRALPIGGGILARRLFDRWKG